MVRFTQLGAIMSVRVCQESNTRVNKDAVFLVSVCK